MAVPRKLFAERHHRLTLQRQDSSSFLFCPFVLPPDTLQDLERAKKQWLNQARDINSALTFVLKVYAPNLYICLWCVGC